MKGVVRGKILISIWEIGPSEKSGHTKIVFIDSADMGIDPPAILRGMILSKRSERILKIEKKAKELK